MRFSSILPLKIVHILAVLFTALAISRGVVQRFPGLFFRPAWRGGGTGTEFLEILLFIFALFILLAQLYCATFGFATCKSKTILVLYFLWLGFFTWYSWFSMSAPFRLHELHSFDPLEIRKEITRHYYAAIPMFVLLASVYGILPLIALRRAREH